MFPLIPTVIHIVNDSRIATYSRIVTYYRIVRHYPIPSLREGTARERVQRERAGVCRGRQHTAPVG